MKIKAADHDGSGCCALFRDANPVSLVCRDRRSVAHHSIFFIQRAALEQLGICLDRLGCGGHALAEG